MQKNEYGRSTFKVLFYVNGSKEKNGIVPIMGRVTINGTVAQFSCKQSVPKTLWDIKGNRAKGKSRKARDINLALDNIKAQIIKHYQRISDREAFVTAEMVRNAYQGIGSEYETLLKAFDKENEAFKKRAGKDMVLCTYRTRIWARNHVVAFIQFHIRPNVKERGYLMEDELKSVMTHEFADSKLAYIRDILVFAYFTALSFMDIQGLTNDNIVEVNGEKWILSKRHKTKVPFQVKLLEIPLQIIKRYRPMQMDNLVFSGLNYWCISILLIKG